MLSKTKEIFLVWLIIFLAIMIRVWKADYYPIHNNDDGLFYVWAGTSSYKNFLKPASLTIFVKDNPSLFWHSQYNNTDVVRRFALRLIQPFFDLPPLATFFIALPAKIFGFNDFAQIPHLLVRLPALLISILTLYLSYILAKNLFSKKVAFYTLLVYSFTPFFVFSQRQSYLENFLTPVILGSLIALRKYLQKPKKIWLAIILATSLIAGWIKVPGFGLFLITCFWLLKNRKIKPFFLNLCFGIISVALYLLYGALINWQGFAFTVFNQAARGIYLSSFVHIFTRPEFYEYFPDGWYFLNFICMFSLIIQKWHDKKARFLCLNFIFWLFFILLTSGVNNNSPWYRYPLFPFLSMATGYFLNLLMEKSNLMLMIPLFLFGFSNLDLLGYSINITYLRFFYILIMTPYVLKLLFPKINPIKKFAKIFSIILLCLSFSINILVPFKYLSGRCQESNCLLPEKIMVDLP